MRKALSLHQTPRNRSARRPRSNYPRIRKVAGWGLPLHFESQENSSFDHKTLRSVILKQIQSKYSKNNNDPSTILKAGALQKKSDQSITWAQRWCVIDGKEFRYYYEESEVSQRREPLCVILLKHINSVLPLNEKEKDNKDWAF